jgi:hypothetical protein
MKTIKLLALMLVGLIGMTACSSDDDNKHKPIIDPVEGLNGYIFVSSGYFKDSYYGNQATMSVKAENDQYTVSFHDPQWGDVDFENVTFDEAQQTFSGTGTLTMVYRGKEGKYAASVNGNPEEFVITMPDVMGGTAITFYAGKAPLACELNGNFSGINTIEVGGNPYPVNITYKVTANPDSTINISLPEYQVEGTPMGDLTLGAYALKNIAYDEEKGAFYSLYGEGVKEHLTAVRNGVTTIDEDYELDASSYIQVEKTENGIKVINSFKPGAMPFPIVATFETAAE